MDGGNEEGRWVDRERDEVRRGSWVDRGGEEGIRVVDEVT